MDELAEWAAIAGVLSRSGSPTDVDAHIDRLLAALDQLTDEHHEAICAALRAAS